MKFSLTKSWTVVLTLLALMFSAIGVATAHAAVIVVNYLDVDITVYDFHCTLREAIQTPTTTPRPSPIALQAVAQTSSRLV